MVSTQRFKTQGRKTKSLFSLIEELQQIHGLRVDDFVRYRRYCSRKLERLRSKFQMKNSQVKISQDHVKENPEYLHLVLFKCEWFLAQINQLRNELSNNSRKKHHLRSLCLNSLKSIEELLLLSQYEIQTASKDEENNLRLEYLAYCNLFKGIVKNELKDFSSAYNCLQKSKIIIEELISRERVLDDNDTMKDDSSTPLHGRLNEIETVLRVCQYSADMYDVVIAEETDALSEFKMNQLAEKFKESEIKKKNEDILMKFGPNYFKLSPSIFIGDRTLKNLQKSRKELKESSDYKNSLLQVAYFENCHLRKILKRDLLRGQQKSKGKVPTLQVDKLFKIISRIKGYEADPNFSMSIDLFCNLLKCVKEKNDEKIIEAYKLIKKNKKMFDEYNMFLVFIVYRKRMHNFMPIEVKKTQPVVNVMESSFVPPKPSFYDMAFDCLSSNNFEIVESKESLSFSNLLTNFWGKK